MYDDLMSMLEYWCNIILVGFVNYIDVGLIVVGFVVLVFWKIWYGLFDSFIGLIGVFLVNVIFVGVGVLIGGMLCDCYGCKKIYQYDMLFYVFGMLFLVFVSVLWMIIVGFLLVGLVVGVDILVSWLLIVE